MLTNDAIYRDLNSVVMDYLVSEGYPSAARRFASEANVQPTSGVNSIQERIEIREAIHSGDIQIAIEKINELNPMVSPVDCNFFLPRLFAMIRPMFHAPLIRLSGH